MYFLTFLGLYLELAGAFLLSAEAIGKDNLLALADKLERYRWYSFAVMVLLVMAVIFFSRRYPVLHFREALVIILSIGLLNDFAPKLFRLLVRKTERGTAGVIGFLLFAIGFAFQAYVSLSLLY
ncbi:hypothetical protein H8E52_04930 [bacterium]|nr:hypothetical protein [bacterium]